MRFFLLLAVALQFLLVAPSAALASRRGFMPVSYYAQQMDLAVVVDVGAPAAPDFQYKLTVREVLQGKAQVGDIIMLPGRISTADVPLRGGSTLAVLLKKNKGADASPWQVLEAYSSPQSITNLKLLLTVYQLPAEREQLLALQKIVRDGKVAPEDIMLTMELASALSGMREAMNFDLIGSVLPLLNETQRADFMTTLGTMNDLRAVPLLLSALNDPSKKIRGTAAQTLTYRYPGAPGVTEAMRAVLLDGEVNEFLKRTAQDYLAKRDARVKVEKPTTPFHEAKALFQKDKTAGARALLGVMENKESGIFAGTSIISWTGEEILPFLDAEGKARLRALILRQAAQQNDYLQAESLLKLIRLMPDITLVPALQNLLHDMRPKSLYYQTDKADMLATFTLRNLGPIARESGTAQALKNLQLRLNADKKPNADEMQTLLMPLAFLADAATWRSVPESMDKEWQPVWESLGSVRLALASKNEAQSLVALLKNPPKELTRDVKSWIIYRLGDLGDASAVEFLLTALPKTFDYAAYAVKEALIQIGGAPVEAGALALLKHNDGETRRQAMDMLKELQGEKMRPLLRRVLQEENFGDKPHAAFLLGYVGTPDDLPLLLSYADFWKADRSGQYWAASSVASIRERFHYDINGPIRKMG